MANYESRVGNATLLIEAKSSSAFAKSESGIRPDPLGAIEAMIKNVKMIAGMVSKEVGPAVMNSPVNFSMDFSVRADGNGLVMIGDTPESGQFRCTVAFTGGRPTQKSRPPAARNKQLG